MLLYLYALADDLTNVSGLSGLELEPLVLVSLGGAVAVGGWMQRAPSVDRNTLIAQDRLVRELHSRAGALLPMRFGSCTGDADALARSVETLSPDVRRRLDLVRGRDQMTIRALGAADAAATTTATGASTIADEYGLPDMAGPGTRYLAARAIRAIPPALAPLLDALKPLQRATRVEAGRHAGLIGTIYQLVDRGSSDAYRRAIDEAARHSPSLTLRVTGPSPAYAFARETV
jgi:hypothetical protein